MGAENLHPKIRENQKAGGRSKPLETRQPWLYSEPFTVLSVKNSLVQILKNPDGRFKNFGDQATTPSRAMQTRTSHSKPVGAKLNETAMCRATPTSRRAVRIAHRASQRGRKRNTEEKETKGQSTEGGGEGASDLSTFWDQRSPDLRRQSPDRLVLVRVVYLKAMLLSISLPGSQIY
ncbi:hypothetical protein U1Q18_032358 [Sarracenia purpurea var. burkii]